MTGLFRRDELFGGIQMNLANPKVLASIISLNPPKRRGPILRALQAESPKMFSDVHDLLVTADVELVTEDQNMANDDVQAPTLRLGGIPSPELTPEQINAARQVIQQNQQRKWEACWQEIRGVLQKHRCELVAVARLTPDGRIAAVPQIVDATG